MSPGLKIDRVSGIEDACDVVDSLPYALTGGLFARDPGVVRYVRQRSPVGNLYVNVCESRNGSATSANCDAAPREPFASEVDGDVLSVVSLTAS